MNAREIELFRAIMHCRTLSAAAQMLHVTQPALSKVLRHCEDRLGYLLFHRTAGRLVPTAEANALILDADRMYQQIQGFGALARELGGRSGGILREGATSSLATSLVPRAVARLRQEPTQARVVLLGVGEAHGLAHHGVRGEAVGAGVDLADDEVDHFTGLAADARAGVLQREVGGQRGL